MLLSDKIAVMTDGTALGRMPTLLEVADAAAIVVSDRASAMTGASSTERAARS